MRKEKEKEQEKLQKELENIENELKKKPGKKKLEKKRRMIQQQILTFETQEVTWALKKTQQRVFEGANKPGKYLAYILKKKRENKIINKITVEGKELTNREEI